MTIATIRNKMAFEEAYILPNHDLEIRLYSTKKAGAYGYQYAAIVWYKGIGYASSKTSGCGYDKISTAVAEALMLASKARGDDPEKTQKIWDFGGSGQIEECIAEFLGVDYSNWHIFIDWCRNNLIHAHG